MPKEGTFRSNNIESFKDIAGRHNDSRIRTIVLEGFDAVTMGGFTQVPNIVLKSEKLSAGEKLTYAMLLSYAWQNESCFPGQETLAKDMGCTRQSANGYLKGLKKKGFIEIRRRGLGQTNIYVVKATVSSKKGITQ